MGDLRRSRLFVADIDGNNRREMPVAFESGTTVRVCWSPDGSRLALDMTYQNREGTIAVVNQDGTNFRKVPLPPGRWSPYVYDWETLTPGLRVGAADDSDRTTLRGRFQTLQTEFRTAAINYEQAKMKGKVSDSPPGIYKELYPYAKPYVGRFLAIAESAPDDPSGLDALGMSVAIGEGGPAFLAQSTSSPSATPGHEEQVARCLTWPGRRHRSRKS